MSRENHEATLREWEEFRAAGYEGSEPIIVPLARMSLALEDTIDVVTLDVVTHLAALKREAARKTRVFSRAWKQLTRH